MSDTYSYQGIEIHRKYPEWVNEFSGSLLEKFYLRKGETVPMALARPATAFCFGDYELAQRIYDYVYKGWFMYASPVLSNAPKGRWYQDGTKTGAHYWYKHTFIPEEKIVGMPISCFAFTVEDSLDGQMKAMEELASLSCMGGGTGAHNKIRAVSDKAPGPIPYMKVLDSTVGYYKQPHRRGALAYYMDIDHPDIVEHIKFRVPGGDSKRRSDNRTQFHSAVNLTDEFIQAVFDNEDIELRCPHSHEVREVVSARYLWELILDTRALQGEPYLMKIDLANRRMPETQKKLGLKINGSNLCSEITLPTDEHRSFVCCLSSLNLEKYEEWKDTTIVADLTRFLDNVLEYFIKNAPDTLSKAKYSAERERALGLGTMGWHAFLQSKMIPFESGGFNSASQWSNIIFKQIHDQAEAESRKLAEERGEAPDMKGTGLRNSRRTATAPNAASGDLMGTSPSIEPFFQNVFVKGTRAGEFVVKNRYLEALLEQKGMNTRQVWKSIESADGSVQHLDFLSEHEKKVFKTFGEIDQHWIIELAEQRGKYICQAQSLNVYFPSGSSKSYINSVHLKFLKSDNVVTMYYFRTNREASVDTTKEVVRVPLKDWNPQEEKAPVLEEAPLKQTTQRKVQDLDSSVGDCLSCQG